MFEICQRSQVLLSEQYQNNTLAHAIIIQGIAGTGKRNLANWLIELLICQQPETTLTVSGEAKLSQACGRCKACLLNRSDNYPDHLLLTSENKTIGVDDIRRGNSFLEKTAHLGQVKTVLLPDATSMTIAASNALLKTLEEPNANNYIVLLTDDIDALLPTIVSRCAVFTVKAEVGQALLNQVNFSPELNTGFFDINIDEAAFINSSQLPELTNEQAFIAHQQFSQCYLSFLKTGQEEKQLLAQLIEQKHALRWLEKITCNLVRKFYLANNTAQTNFNNEVGVTVTVLNQVHQAIINSNKLIKSYTQVNRQFVCEQLLVTLINLIRQSK